MGSTATTMIEASAIQDTLRSSLRVHHLVVEDTSSGCGTNYSVIIVSDDFEGKNTLARHKLVHEVLSAQIAEMHAFSQKTLTIAQYDTQKAKGLLT